MKSIKSALLGYSAAKFILAAGTFIFLFIVGYGFVDIRTDHWFYAFITSLLAIFSGSFLGVIGLTLFDSGFDHLEDVGRDANGQEKEAAEAAGLTYTPMPKTERVMSYVLGSSGVLGSTVISIVAAGLFAFSVTDDQSGVTRQMEATQTKADATYNKELSMAQQSVTQAQQQLNAATAKAATATKDAIAAIGGDFAARKRRGNDEWVEVAAVYSESRKQVRIAQQLADDNVTSARAQLADARATLNDVLRNGKNRATAGAKPALDGMKLVLDSWVTQVQTLKILIIRSDIVSGILAIIFHIFLRIKKRLPDEPTIIEQMMRFARLTSSATVYALDTSVTAAEKALEDKMGIVAHPNTATVSQQLQQAQQAQPVATAQQSATTAQQPTATTPQPQHGATNGKPQQSATTKQQATIQSAIRMCRSRMAKAEAAFVAKIIDEERKNAILAAQQTAIAAHRERLENLEA